jgi:hypothetical protein
MLAYHNDEGSEWLVKTPEDRWERMRRWIERHLRP